MDKRTTKPEETAVAETKAAAVEEKETAAEKKAVAAEPKKTRAKRGTKTVKKTEKVEMVPEVLLQFQGHEDNVGNVVEKAKAEYVAAGHRVSSIKSLQVYLKPEEYAVYYVINQKFEGKINLF
ncbi:MAG: hypothetical protein HDQ95_13560 [Roseburia sp.]|nr:hypothetical protein [Roseburia sp.]